jgi:hypothetical protein
LHRIDSIDGASERWRSAARGLVSEVRNSLEWHVSTRFEGFSRAADVFACNHPGRRAAA